MAGSVINSHLALFINCSNINESNELHIYFQCYIRFFHYTRKIYESKQDIFKYEINIIQHCQKTIQLVISYY